MAAVRAARFVVPVVAEPTEVDTTGEHTVDTRVDLAAVTLVAPDGQRALPVFSGTAALAAWDATARPVPVTPARAAQAAVSEGCDVIVVDVAGPVDPGAAPVDGVGAGPAAARGSPPTPTPSSPGASRRPSVTRTTSRHPRSRRATRAVRASSASSSTCAPAWPPSRCAPSRRGWGSGWPPTASCGPASTASPSASADRISADAVALVASCVDRPPSGAVCKRSPASTRVDHEVAGSEQVRDTCRATPLTGVATASRGGPVGTEDQAPRARGTRSLSRARGSGPLT